MSRLARAVRIVALVFMAVPLLAATAWAKPAAASSDPPPGMSRAVAWHDDGPIVVWGGQKRLFRSAVHELLHRATEHVDPTARLALQFLSRDSRPMNEGLTAYFTGRALELAGKPATYPDPPAGATRGQLRRHLRTLRAEAQAAVRTLGVEVGTEQIRICSEAAFARRYLKKNGMPWAYEAIPPDYADVKGRVQQMVELVGEGPVHRAYFQGDVAGLRAALLEARRRGPATFPSWLGI